MTRPRRPSTAPRRVRNRRAWRLGHIDGHTYVFVGLERDNGIVTFDITDPHAPHCVAYTNPAEYPDHPAKIAGDIGPEGLYFVARRAEPHA